MTVDFLFYPIQGAHCINTTAVVVGCVVGVALLAVLMIAASVVVTSIVLKRRKHRVDLSTTSHTEYVYIIHYSRLCCYCIILA